VGEELHRGRLDRDGIQALFADYRDAARVFSVRVKGGFQVQAQGANDLSLALEALLSKAARGVQVHYLFEGERWCDTILVGPHGWRVIRSHGEFKQPR